MSYPITLKNAGPVEFCARAASCAHTCDLHKLCLGSGLLLHKLVAPLQRGGGVRLVAGRGEGEVAQRLQGQGQVGGVSQRLPRVQIDPHHGGTVVLTPQDVTWHKDTHKGTGFDPNVQPDCRQSGASLMM